MKGIPINLPPHSEKTTLEKPGLIKVEIPAFETYFKN